MRVLSLIFLFFLVFIVVLYTTIGLRFSIVKKRRVHLALYFFAGLCVGIIGGFVFLYNLEISGNAVFFTIEFRRWLSVTALAIFLGGLLSHFIILKNRKK